MKGLISQITGLWVLIIKAPPTGKAVDNTQCFTATLASGGKCQLSTKLPNFPVQTMKMAPQKSFKKSP